MNTKFIKIAICAFSFGLLSLNADDGAAAVGIQLSTIKTISGKVYKGVELITADASGLLFRHSQGMAKVDFADLNKNVREMFETEQEPPAEAVVDAAAAADVSDEDEDSIENLETVTRTRIVITMPQSHGYCCETRCNPFNPATVNWRSHWGRYHYGLAYANFYCRQAAERELLRRSGFLR